MAPSVNGISPVGPAPGPANAAASDASPERSILDAFETVARLYRSLRRLSERQRRLIETGRGSDLLRLLDAKQSIVERLKEVQPALEKAVAGWKAEGGRLPLPLRERIRALLGEINDVMQAVMAADEEDGRLLALRRTVVGQRLTEQEGARRAGQAYRPTPAEVTGRRLDRKD